MKSWVELVTACIAGCAFSFRKVKQIKNGKLICFAQQWHQIRICNRKKPIKIIVSDNIIGIGLWDAAKQNLAWVKVVQLFIILQIPKIFITFCSLKPRSWLKIKAWQEVRLLSIPRVKMEPWWNTRKWHKSRPWNIYSLFCYPRRRTSVCRW